MKAFVCLITLGLMALPASAAIVVDGSKDASYGSALAVQTVDTEFGDPSGSELDAAYAKVWGGRLYLLLTGNLEGNFNKLDIFIDSKAGGENVLSGAPGNDGTGVMAGLKFDAGFTADYGIIARHGNDNGNDKFDLDFSELGTANYSSYQDFLVGSGQNGVGTTGAPTATGGTGGNASPISAGMDNTNVLGVVGGTAAADPVAAAAVTTGLELSIDLADIGSPVVGDTIQISAMVNNGSHDFLSNQFLGGLPAGTGNLGISSPDLTTFAGDQFFSFVIAAEVPEPATLALAGLALAATVFSRRRFS